MSQISTAIGDTFHGFTGFSIEKPAGTPAVSEWGDGGHALRRMVRKLYALLYGEEFNKIYTPPVSSEFGGGTASRAEREYIKKNAPTDGSVELPPPPMVSVAVLRKALLRFFDKDVFSCDRTQTILSFSAFSGNGDEFAFVFYPQWI